MIKRNPNKTKRPLLWRSKNREFNFLWVYRICFIFTSEAEHDNPRKFVEVWKTKKTLSLIVGKIGFGIGHSFGLKW